MGAINHREVLLVHDGRRLKQAAATIDALAALDPAEGGGVGASSRSSCRASRVVSGRSPELDQALRDFSARPATPTRRRGAPALETLVTTTLASVGERLDSRAMAA